MEKHKAAVFDMDGVIIDSGPVHLEAWKRTFEARNLPFDEGRFRQSYGMRDSEVIPRLIGIMSDEETQQLADFKSRVFQELIRSSAQVVDGLSEYIERLHEWQVITAVASLASSAEIEAMLSAAGLHEKLQVIITRDQSMKDKPAPDIFLTAAYRLGFQPSEIVVFEDAVNGVEAARSAGATTVAITTSYSPGELSHADLVVENFHDPALLQLFSSAS